MLINNNSYNSVVAIDRFCSYLKQVLQLQTTPIIAMPLTRAHNILLYLFLHNILLSYYILFIYCMYGYYLHNILHNILVGYYALLPLMMKIANLSIIFTRFSHEDGYAR